MKWLILAVVALMLLLGLWYWSQKNKEEYGLTPILTSAPIVKRKFAIPTLRTQKDLAMN